MYRSSGAADRVHEEEEELRRAARQPDYGTYEHQGAYPGGSGGRHDRDRRDRETPGFWERNQDRARRLPGVARDSIRRRLRPERGSEDRR